jgi:FG-GAP-like repeat/Putative Ig domain/FG-GAP repeat
MSLIRACLAALLAAIAIVLGGCSSPGPISVTVSPNSPQAIDQGLSVAITATITNDRSGRGITWTLNGPGSLSSSTGLSITYQSPTTSIASPQHVTVTAASAEDQVKNASVTITVNPDPAIPISQALANGTVGTPYSEAIALAGGTAPFQWSIYNGPIETGWEVGGAVPDGLTLDAATGTISGTPTAAGTWNFEATVADADNEGAIDAFLSIQINPIATAANPVPFLNQPLVPTAVSPGGSGFTLSVGGAGFVSGSTVDFNGAPLTTTFVDREHLIAFVPAASVATAQTVSVTVVNPAAGGGSSNVVYFQVGAPESTVNFANASNSPTQIEEPFGLAAADFNQDGKTDLAIAANVQLYVMLGDGDGAFTPAPNSPLRVPSPPYNDAASPYVSALAEGDFTHSGHPGLAVAQMENEAAEILIGNGNGTFAPSSAVFAYAPGQPTSAMEAADFNADGNLDLAIINEISGVSLVDLGYGKGAFNTAGDLYTQGFPAGAAVGDFNGDGKLDVAVACGGAIKYPDSAVTVSLGNGDGTFTQANGSPISLGQSLSAIVAGDFNGDGKLDLAVADAGASSVLVLLGNGDGTFQSPITIAVGNGPDAIAVGDFNNDGKIDLAVTNSVDNTVTLLLGNGNGTFTEASGSPYAVGKGPSAIVAADFNGDGKLDLAVTNITDETVSILLQQ